MKIYLMGICGTAMAHVALLFKELGHSVVGSDTQFFDPIANLLIKNQIETHTGFDAQRLQTLKPDCVIVGNIISRGNPEVEYLLNEPICPLYSFPQFLEQHIIPRRSTFVVTGTHGKTTTTTLLTYLLKQFCDPGYLIGGLPNNFEHGTSWGDAKAPFVLEGDEYDTAFFDKKSKFFHYWPHTLIISNIEFDHADIFDDLKSIQRTFYQLTRMVPSHGHIVMNGDDPNVTALLPCDWTHTHCVGFKKQNEWQIKNFITTPRGSQFDLCKSEKCIFANICLPLLGRFNAHNAALAIVACYVNQYTAIDVQRLTLFSGVHRRQSMLFESEQLTILEDFAHHPTAIRSVLETLKAHYPRHYLIACFEPACNTSASTWFAQQSYPTFSCADEVWFAPRKANIYCDKFIQPLVPMDFTQVQQTLQQNGIKVNVFGSLNELIACIEGLTPTVPTLLCCFSNGRLSTLLSNTQRKMHRHG
ncbi:MAG: Mur ligase domain-containing protein [Puniceicoccales bacterium]|jgi:UDP-N-acetylmuramate: L-alanyl-gamma-D-glutamyl-meso-diaminopimelate ligase|nr:Mur ligase domain-containing protein [Puniceicoccales bacterium]